MQANRVPEPSSGVAMGSVVMKTDRSGPLNHPSRRLATGGIHSEEAQGMRKESSPLNSAPRLFRAEEVDLAAFDLSV